MDTTEQLTFSLLGGRKAFFLKVCDYQPHWHHENFLSTHQPVPRAGLTQSTSYRGQHQPSELKPQISLSQPACVTFQGLHFVPLVMALLPPASPKCHLALGFWVCPSRYSRDCCTHSPAAIITHTCPALQGSHVATKVTQNKVNLHLSSWVTLDTSQVFTNHVG